LGWIYNSNYNYRNITGDRRICDYDIKMKEDKQKYQDIKLKSGIEVTVDWESKTKCKKCKKEIWFAVTHKNLKVMPIELVGLAKWDSHFATCPFADEFRKK